jgi:demethylphylloquinone reductase
MAKKIVIIGGGHGGLFTALELAGSGDVTLVSDTDYFCFKPLLYEYLSGEVEAWHIAPYYKELFDNEINFIKASIETIDFTTNTVKLSAEKGKLVYDVLVLAVGGVTNFRDVKGAEEFALPFRNIVDTDKLRSRMISAIDTISPTLPPQDVREKSTFAIVGGGASGVELATKMSDLLYDAFRQRNLPGEPRIILLEMGDRLVAGMGTDLRKIVEKSLHDCRVDIHTKTRVLEVKSDGIISEHDGKQTETKVAATIWVAGVKPNPLSETLNLEKNKQGLVLAEATLQAKGKDNVFVLGDIAFVDDVAPILLGTAQLANQEATLAAENIKLFLHDKPLKTKHFAELGEALSLGTENAAVLVAGKAVSGEIARKARFALYSQRLPTWHHRLKVGSTWFFNGTNPRPLGLE